ncbi:ATP-binding cassette, subfamily B [Acrasis kona]|uniref:ATP-binding cassette, subfamily B n=1 Tax=Acrasis kona TaxID=1008807 RepID=A0AAW2Z6F1_9EUKA
MTTSNSPKDEKLDELIQDVSRNDFSVEIGTTAILESAPALQDKPNEELIYKADEDEQVKDDREPNVSNLAVVSVIGVDWLFVLLGVAFSLAQGVVPPVFYLLLGQLFTSITTASAEEIKVQTATLAKYVAIIAIYPTFVSFFQNTIMSYASQRVGNRIKRTYFNSVTRQEIGYFDIKKSGSIANALSDDVNKVTDAFSTNLQSLAQYSSQIITGVIIALTANWQMALLQMTSFPIMIFIFIICGNILKLLARRSSIQSGDSVSTANEVITSMRTVRSMAGEEKEITRYETNLNKVLRTGVLFSFVKGLSIGAVTFFNWGAVSLAFWYAGQELEAGIINVGSLIRVFGSLLMALIGFMQMFTVFPEVAKAQASIGILLKAICRVPAINYKGGKTLENIQGRISFKNITFRYPSRKKVVVLDDFSLDIDPGTSVALVGQSGSGKSTIVGLLEKWYEPEKGTITLDGVDLKEIDPQWLHRYLGIVSQEPTLFATTIKKNITYAVDTINMIITEHEMKTNPKNYLTTVQSKLIPVTDELIVQAAISANCHDFISKLPNQYDTVIGERGVSLSGGQKQRIAIARSVLQDPKMLLLDEATSALDTKSESLVQDALNKLMIGRTSIVIAHRLTTVQDCDNIVVMVRGKIVEQGPHDQMIQNINGPYYNLAQKQMKFGQNKDSSSSTSSDEMSGDISDAEEEIPIEEVPLIDNSKAVQIVEAPVTPITEAHLEQPKSGRNKRNKLLKKKIVELSNEDVVDHREPRIRTTVSLVPMVGIEWFYVIISAVFSFIVGALPILFYVIFSRVITAISPSRDANGTLIPFPPDFSYARTVSAYAGYMAILAGGGSICQFFNQFFTTLAAERISVRIKKRYFRAMVNQEMGFFDIKKSGKLLSSLAEDVQSVSEGFTLKLSLFANHVSQIIIGIVLALIACWQLSLVMIAGIFPISGVFIFFTSLLINRFNHRIIKLNASALATSNEVIGALRTVRSMAGEDREQNRFNNDLKKVVSTSLYKAITLGVSVGGIEYCIWSVNALGFWYGGQLVAQGVIPSGSLLQVLGNMIIVIFAVSMAMGEMQHFYKSHTSAMEMLRVTQRTPAIPIKGGHVPSKIEGYVEFRNITFSYPSRPNQDVMMDFSLDIKVGQHVALVGESGSGKSTIVGLLERFYDPSKGQVLLDGVDVREIDPEWLHRNVAIVTQEPTLFATTIEKNITYAMTEPVSRERVIEVAKNANCYDFIVNLQDGFDTMIGERGVSMSGGQKQRIAIARAMLQNTNVLLLDEATSALDAEAESLVQDALNKLMVGKTTIVIAHRLSTVQDCDLIVAMKQGRVVEQGSHQELIKKRGMYYKLALKQMEFGMSSSEKKFSKTVDLSESD